MSVDEAIAIVQGHYGKASYDADPVSAYYMVAALLAGRIPEGISGCVSCGMTA